MTLEIHSAGNDEMNTPLRMLVAGQAGVRKTLFAGKFPAPLFAFSGGCLPELALNESHYVKVNSENDLFEISKLLSDEDCQYETLVIDTIDGLQNVLLDDRMASQGRTEMKIDDWKWLEQRLRAIFGGLTKLRQHLVVLCNIKDITVDGNSLFQPAIQGGFSNQVNQFLTHSLWLKGSVSPRDPEEPAKLEERFCLQAEPSESAGWVADFTHTLGPVFEVNFEDDFERIYGMREWHSELADSSLIQVEVAKPIQEPEAEPEAEVETDSAVQVEGDSDPVCAVCGKQVEDPWVNLSKLRFGAVHCVDCFKAAN